MRMLYLQQILSDRLLLTVTDRRKSNFNDKYKFEHITTCHL